MVTYIITIYNKDGTMKTKLKTIKSYYNTMYIYSNIDNSDRCIITIANNLSRLSINTDWLSYNRTVANHYKRAIAKHFGDHADKYNKVISLYNKLVGYNKFLINSNSGSNYQDAMDKFLSDNAMTLSSDGFGSIYADIKL